MVFDCQQCGECCSHLGLVHSITEDRGNYEFVVFNRYTNESNVVTVDAEKHALFDDKSIFTSLPEACPFFRHQPGSGKSVLHGAPDPADICRDYSCWRMLIVNRLGRGWAGSCSRDTSARRIRWCFGFLQSASTR